VCVFVGAEPLLVQSLSTTMSATLAPDVDTDVLTKPNMLALASMFFEAGADQYEEESFDEAEVSLRKAKIIYDRLSPTSLLAAQNRETLGKVLEANGYVVEAREVRTAHENNMVCSNYLKCLSTRTFSLSELKVCSKCKSVFYCSPHCQKADWKVHKRYCTIVKSGIDAIPVNWRAEARDLEKRGYFKRAEEWYRKVLETEEAQSGPYSVEVSRACSALGMNLYKAGNVVEANKYLKRSITIFNKIVYKKDSDILSRNAVSDILSSKGQLQEMEDLGRNPDVQLCANFHCENDVNIVNMILSDNYESPAVPCRRCETFRYCTSTCEEIDKEHHKPFCVVVKLPWQA